MRNERTGSSCRIAEEEELLLTDDGDRTDVIGGGGDNEGDDAGVGDGGGGDGGGGDGGGGDGGDDYGEEDFSSEDSDGFDPERIQRQREEARRRRREERDEVEERRERRENGIPGMVPVDILSITAPLAVRAGLSHGQHVTILAGFLLASKVDLDHVTLSHSSSIRNRKRAVEEGAETIRSAFTDRVVIHDKKLVLHSDTKALVDAIGVEGARECNQLERQVVTVSVVEQFEVDKLEEQFVAAPRLEGGTGWLQ